MSFLFLQNKLKNKPKERGFYFYKIEVEGLICRESEPRESSFTAILHRFAELDLRLLQRPVGELFVEVARVFVPVQCRNKWRSDSSLKSLTEQYNLQNFPTCSMACQSVPKKKKWRLTQSAPWPPRRFSGSWHFCFHLKYSAYLRQKPSHSLPTIFGQLLN